MNRNVCIKNTLIGSWSTVSFLASINKLAKCETTGALCDSITEYEIWNNSNFFFVELAFSVTYSCLTPKVNGLKTNAKWLSTRGIFFDVYVLTWRCSFPRWNMFFFNLRKTMERDQSLMNYSFQTSVGV